MADTGGIALAVSNRAGASARRRRNYPRWRAVTLSLVYVVFGIHIIHWQVSGKTLAPLELNEVMYTLELGIITAGFLFMSALVLGTLVFGRFFCSWACHIMVLQDLCAWLLSKVGIRAKPVRSRLLLWVPALTAFYMFIWPQIARAWASRALPTFHVATDRQGWASFVTDNFWRNLPGPGVIAMTFVICGFLIVYLLGSRTFCTYVCPYGAIFALADRFSPGRILVNDSCRQCGRCTGACKSGVRVHEEINRHGMVVNPACLKDLDCVSVCPNSALRYGFSKPALFRSDTGLGRFGLPYEFSWAEELLAAAVFVFVLLSFRGLYGQVPFLLSLALGIIAGHLAIVAARLLRKPAVRLANIQLKRIGRLTCAGRIGAGVLGLSGLFTLHSGFVRWHEYSGLREVRAMEGAVVDDRQELARAALGHLSLADRWGLLVNQRVQRSLIRAAAELSDPATLDRHAVKFLKRYPNDGRVRLTLGRSYVRQGRSSQAQEQFEWIVERAGYASESQSDLVAAAHEELGAMAGRRADFAAAARHLRESIALVPDRATVYADLGSALAELGEYEFGMDCLREALRLDPNLAKANYNLGTLLAMSGRPGEAVPYHKRALVAAPDDADLLNNLGSALLQDGQPGEAEEYLRRAVKRQPTHAHAHFNLAVVLESQHRSNEALSHLQLAAKLDPRYAQFLGPP